MKRYRVKIEERNNGEKRYTPQVGNVSIIGKWQLNLHTNWENILVDDLNKLQIVQTNRLTSYSYRTEQEALNAIEKYKKWLNEEFYTKTKSITYKEV
jgi:hypothetical protein